MDEVAPGIHQLRLPLIGIALEYINDYLIKGERGYLLVDTGFNTDNNFNALQKQLAEIGVSFRDISQIVITHIHPDHYGLVGRLKSLTGARLYVHQRDQELIKDRYITIDDLVLQTALLLKSNGVPPAELDELKTASLPVIKYVTPIPPDVILRGGETITSGAFKFKVLWTPGHSPGHICLYEPEQKILLSGDHILPDISPHIGLHPQFMGNPLGQYIESLKMIRQLDVNLVLPGHGMPFTKLPDRIDELLRHHQERVNSILVRLKSGPQTAYDVARGITWMEDSGGVSWDKLSPWDRRLAVLEVLAHLEAIKADGKVVSNARNGSVYYQRTD